MGSVDTKYPFLQLRTVLTWEPLMARLGVSEVARSPRGFLRAYERSGRTGLGVDWVRRREGFVARHLAQMAANGEGLYDDRGRPTRRHLALVAWAFSPDPSGLAKARRREGG
jgi:hypothetical protein